MQYGSVSRRNSASPGDWLDRPPHGQAVSSMLIRQILPACCALAASGHATAAPQSSVMNLRLLMSDMGIPPLRLPVYHEPTSGFLGADLNRSESRSSLRSLRGLPEAARNRRIATVPLLLLWTIESPRRISEIAQAILAGLNVRRRSSRRLMLTGSHTLGLACYFLNASTAFTWARRKAPCAAKIKPKK
jgi:hypothetical protein